MRDAESEITSRGGRLAIVGNGAPAHAQRFQEDTGLVGKVFTDPSRHTYAALGMKHGLSHTFNLATMRNAWRAYRSGYRQKRRQGDPWQQGGTAVFDAAGELAFLHVSGAAGDHARVDDVLAVVGRLQPGD